MTFIQLEYIVAVDTWKHFARAAKDCFVTQPTLSMQIQKLEKELGVKIFNRERQPVETTHAGVDIIRQARKILAEKKQMMEILDAKKGLITGELKLGIIPTVAPYLLPLFIPAFTSKYPMVKLVVNEMTTEVLISTLRANQLDAGILVLSSSERDLKEQHLYFEEMVAYVSRKNSAYKKTYMLPQDIDPNKLWLLEEGHCLRSQIENLCELRKSSKEGSHFEYEAGSVETLKRLIELNDGITILPELATMNLTAKQTQLLRHFKKPVPVREISLVTNKDFVKKRLVEALRAEIENSIPVKLKRNKNERLVGL